MTSPVLLRLREAALEAKRAEQTYRDSLAHRDRLLVESYGCCPLHEVAAAALLTKPRVINIVARDG